MSCDDPVSGELDAVYVGTNTAHYAAWFDMPALPTGYCWELHFNTGDTQTPRLPTPFKFHDHGILVGERSVVIFSASRHEA